MLLLLMRVNTSVGCTLEIFFILSQALVSSMGENLSFGGRRSSCDRVSFLIIILSVASWNIVLDQRFLPGRYRNDFISMTCARSFATVNICSSAVILGKLNLLHQWKAFTILDLRVFGLHTAKHLQ